MDNLGQLMCEAAMLVRVEVEFIVSCNRPSTEHGRKLQLLEVWQNVMSKCINDSHSIHIHRFFNMYFSSFNMSHVENLSFNECLSFIYEMCNQLDYNGKQVQSYM